MRATFAFVRTRGPYLQSPTLTEKAATPSQFGVPRRSIRKVLLAASVRTRHVPPSLAGPPFKRIGALPACVAVQDSPPVVVTYCSYRLVVPEDRSKINSPLVGDSNQNCEIDPNLDSSNTGF